jgi:hypothetical protein
MLTPSLDDQMDQYCERLTVLCARMPLFKFASELVVQTGRRIDSRSVKEMRPDLFRGSNKTGDEGDSFQEGALTLR